MQVSFTEVYIYTHTHSVRLYIHSVSTVIVVCDKLSGTLRTHQFFYPSSFVAFIFFIVSTGFDVTPSPIFYYLFFSSPSPSQRLNLEL